MQPVQISKTDKGPHDEPRLILTAMMRTISAISKFDVVWRARVVGTLVAYADQGGLSRGRHPTTEESNGNIGETGEEVKKVVGNAF